MAREISRAKPVAEASDRGRLRAVGLIGYPVAHSLSPLMHNAAFRATGFPGVYLLFPVASENLSWAVQGLKALDLLGANVTIPYKSQVMEYLDEISPLAAATGAVNTIHNDGGRLVGYNTDVSGFLASLEEYGLDVCGWDCVLLGAGGACLAVGVALLQAGARSITVLARRAEQAQHTAEHLARLAGEWQMDCRLDWGLLQRPAEAGAVVQSAQLLVNTTPYGMWPRVESTPLVPAEWLRSLRAVYDLVYNPRETALLAAARAEGVLAVGGESMLVHQGAAAFSIWTQLAAPLAEMRGAVEQALARSDA